MKLLKNILFCKYLVLVLYSCNLDVNCNKVTLAKADLDFFNIYNISDTIILKSNKEHFDTLIVFDKFRRFSRCNKFELGKNQFEQFTITLTSKMKTKGSNNLVILSFKMRSDEREISEKCFYVYDLSFCKEVAERDVICDSLYSDKIKTNINTYFFNTSNSLSDGSYIKSFNWSKEFGLIRYETKEGEVFQLI